MVVLFGVTQGSVNGPILFIFQMVEQFDVIFSYGLDCARNIQVLYIISVPATVTQDGLLESPNASRISTS